MGAVVSTEVSAASTNQGSGVRIPAGAPRLCEAAHRSDGLQRLDDVGSDLRYHLRETIAQRWYGMRQTTTFVMLSLAAVLAACASHAPVPATATGTSQAVAPAPALAAGQQQHPSSFDGYRRVVVNGQERFCQLTDVQGSRIKQEICLTRAQVEAAQVDSQRLLQEIEQKISACYPTPVMGVGDPLGSLQCVQ